MRRAGVALAVAVVVAVALAWWLRHRGGAPTAAAAGEARSADAERRGGAAAAADAGARARKKVVRDASGAQELRREVQTARSRRLARAAAPAASGGPGAAATGASAEPDPTLDKDYLRAQVHDIVPLVAECYQQALERDPRIEGTVNVRFTIGGEPGVGGVIEASEIVADGTTIADAELRQCVTETMYAIELEAPHEGGTVTVVYPFAFRPAD
jgi:hypothetical protein